MTPLCEQVMDRLGQGPLPPELEAHARGCANCQTLLSAFGMLKAPVAAPAPAPSASERLRAQALQELAANPKPSPWWREAVGVVLLSLVVVGVGVGVLGKHGLVQNQATPAALLSVAVLLLGIIAWGAFVALAPGGRMMRRGLVAFALETAGVVAIAGSGLNVSAPFLKAGLSCFVTELTVSAVPLAFALWMLARIAYQPSRALAAGLGTGAVGMLALHFHCACGTLAHLALFHVVPWLLLAGAAVIVRSRLPSRSFAP